ncbi:MAG TPA: HD domain-containing protein, partial [Acidothermaceae bacterium]
MPSRAVPERVANALDEPAPDMPGVTELAGVVAVAADAEPVEEAELIAERELAAAAADGSEGPDSAEGSDGGDGGDDANEQSAPSSGRRVRARLARLATPRTSTTTSPVLEPLIRSIRLTHPKADTRAIQRAYDVAEHHHRLQFRKSGDPYITHPLAVATILAELGMTPPTIVAALLHDTVEDTEYTLETLRTDFGDEVAALVDGVTKLDRVKYGDAATAETVRKMVVAMARDPRVLVLKLADRLHNMRTLRYLPAEKQERKARETLEIYAPLAHRLGMNTLKWEL